MVSTLKHGTEAIMDEEIHVQLCEEPEIGIVHHYHHFKFIKSKQENTFQA